jgi:hypothetical protein
MATRAIITHQPDVSCDMCGRRLLRGERPDVFLAAGSRRTVCELCIPRAAGEGWKRESETLAKAAASSPRTRRGRSLLDRLRQRRGMQEGAQAEEEQREEWAALSAESWRDAPAGGWSPHEQDDWAQEQERPAGEDERSESDLAGQHEHDLAQEPAYEPLATQTFEQAGCQSLDLAEPVAEQAIEIFNASECAGRVAGIARALGQPRVTVRAHESDGERAMVVVAWELCWYRYEIDLRGRPATIALLTDGTELEELPPEDMLANASADERGELSLLR